MNRMKSTIQSYTGTPKELKLERERNFVKYGKMSQNWPSQYGVPMHIGDGDDTVAPTNKKLKTNVVDNTKKSQPFNPVNKKGSKTVVPLEFPNGIGVDRSQGHYMLFTVRTQAPSALSVRKVAGSAGGASLRSQFQSNLQISEMIAMYMPAQVQVSDFMKYGDQEVGVGGLALGKGVLDYQRGGSLMSAVGTGLGDAFSAKLVDFVSGAMNFLGGGATAAQIATGIVRTPHMELMFEAVNRREFNYTFTMTPRNETEAATIEKIVKVFRKEMHPDYVDVGAQLSGLGNGNDISPPTSLADFGASISRFMNFPSVFEIEYKFLGGNDAPMPKPRMCSLTKCDVTYGGGEGYVSVGEGGSPQKTTMALSFAEIDIMTKTHVEAGH